MIRKLKHSLLIIIILVSHTINAQFVVQYPEVAQGMTACLNASALKIKIDVATLSSDNNSVAIQLAPGVTYVSGSLNQTDGTPGLTIAENGGTPAVPIFTISPTTLTVGQFIEFVIQRQAGCASRQHALINGVFKDAVVVSGSGGTTIENDPLINPYNVNFPSFSLIQPPAVNSTVVGGVYSRSFTITNGAIGSANAVHFCLVYPSAGIELVSMYHGANLIAPQTVSGDTLYFTLDGSALGSDALFTNGENVVLSETFRIKKCNTTTFYISGWGCSAQIGGWCQTASGSGSISMATGVGTFSGFTSGLAPGYVDLCGTGNGGYVNLTASYSWSGTGNSIAASAFNVTLRIGGNGGSNSLEAVQTNVYSTMGNVTINSNPVSSTYSGGRLTINLKNFFSFNPDGPGGLEDIDGDGFYDDLAPGSTVQIVFQVGFNCALACNIAIASNAGLAGDIRYNTMCDGVLQTTHRRQGFSWSESNWSANGYMPANVNNNTPFRVRLSCNIGSNTSIFKTSQTRYNWFLKMPPGLQVAGLGNPTWTDGAYYGTNPSAVTTFTISSDTLWILSPSTTMGWAEIDLLYNCGVGGSINSLLLNYGVVQINNISTGCMCMGRMVCASMAAKVYCPGSCGAGPVSYIPTVRRTDNCLGWTNGTMTTRQSASNISAYDLSKALYLDTIQITGSAYQGNDAANLWVRLELGQATSVNKLAPVDLYFEVWRSSILQSSGTITVYSNAASGGGMQRTDWDLTAGLPAGGLVTSDSIFTVSRYVVATNNLTNSDVQSGGTWFFYNLNGPVLEHCNEFVPEMYLVGTTSVNGRNAFNTYACTNAAIGGGTSHIARRFNTAGVKYGSEFRPGLIIDSVVAVIPTGYEFVSAGFNYTAAYNTPGFSIPITPNLISGNTYSFVNPGTWLPLEITVTNTYGATIPFTVRPTCASLPSELIEFRVYIRDYFYANSQTTPYPPGQSGNLLGFSQAIIHTNKGNLQFSDQTGTIQAAAPSENWVVKLENSGLGVTPYTWLAIPNSSSVNVTTVYNHTTNSLLTPISYSGGKWYQLSTTGLATGTDAFYRIHFTYTSCTADSLRILAGWNCGSFPADPTGYSCNAKELFLKYTPVSSEIELAPVSSPSNPNTLCDPLDYEYFINSSQAGNVINNTFTIRAITGIAPVPGSFEVEYPRGANNWFAVPLTVNGLNYNYQLTAHPSYPSSGLPGTINATGNASRQMGIRFSMITNCSFTSATSFRVATSANGTCGAPAQGSGVGLTGTPIFITGAESSYVTVYDLLSSNELTNCNSTSTLSVSSTTVAGVVGNNDFIFIDLPDGIRYIPGSLACSSVDCPIFVSDIFLPGNTERITLQVPPGLLSGTTMNYSIGVTDIQTADCDDHEVIFNAVVAVGGIPCASEPGGSCASVYTSTGSDRVIVKIRRADLQISGFSVVPVPNPPNGESLTLSCSVTNTGLDMLSGQDAYLNFYVDADNNQLFGSSVDYFIIHLPLPQLLHGQSTNLSVATNVPSWTGNCSYLAVVDQEGVKYPSDCICRLQQAQTAPSALVNAGPDKAVCGGGFVTIGTTPISGYAYHWTPTTGLSNPNGAMPVYSSTAAGNSVLTLATTRPGGCTSTDEVTVQVYPVLSRSVVIADPTCFGAGNGTITVTITGGTPPYQISTDNGATYPYSSNSSPFIINNLGPGNYQVRVKDSNGCETVLCQ